MGRAPKWKREEILALAQAWIDASEDHNPDGKEHKIKGADQTCNDFWLKVMYNFELAAPADVEKNYHERKLDPVHHMWRDTIARDLCKFNKALVKVLASQPTGVTEDQKINMAVAIHNNETNTCLHRFKDYNARDWRFYGAWKVVKHHPKFLPPVISASVSVLDDDDSIDDDNANDDNANDNAIDDEDDDDEGEVDALVRPVTKLTTPKSLFKGSSSSGSDSLTPKQKRYSRGRAAGRAKANAKYQDDAYKTKRLKTMAQLVSLQKKKVVSFDTYVNHQGRAQAFEMARRS
jgi:hypothetical protein